MAIDSADGLEVLVQRKYQDLETNPGNIKKQIQPQPKTEKKVAVLYFLSRNGQLEHPHFVEVPLSSPQGLYLKDVIKTLNLLRGQGMASMYSWASKRSYKKGFIWQDLLDDDFIHPCHGEDYILKGSLLLETCLSFRSNESISSSATRRSSEMNSFSSEDSNSPVTLRKNESWSSIDGIHEHKIYKAKTAGELSKRGFSLSTQTNDNQRRTKETEEVEPEGLGMETSSKASMSLESSIEVYKSVDNVRYNKVGRKIPSRRTKDDSKLLMKLCGCGSKRFKDFEQMENGY